MLIDTHAHLYWDSYNNDLDEVIQRSLEAGVNTIINVGVDLKLSETALKQARDKLNSNGLTAYSTIGIHPHEVLRLASLAQDKPSTIDKIIDTNIEKLENIYLSNPKKVVAVGECGLDFAFDRLDELEGIEAEEIKTGQKQLFQGQIDLAKKLNLPLIVHCRDDRSKDPENSEAWDETLNLIGNHTAILHCYSGLPHTTNYILHATNLLLSFAATLTYPKNEYLREAAKLLPLEKIVLETDCPFLPPQSKRGQRNEPANVLEIAKLIAGLKGISLERVEDQTTKNALRILKLTP